MWLRPAAFDWLGDLAQRFYGAPHERYAASLRRSALADTPAGRRWLESAEQSLANARTVHLPHTAQVSFSIDRAEATAFAVTLRRGQRYVAEKHVDGSDPTVVFVDVFERDGAALRRVASAAPDEPAVILEMRADGEYVVRLHAELERDVRATLRLRAEPTLGMPVVVRPRIASFFGDPRDNGRRRHQGVDIFAPRGTPVVAAADGIVSSVGTNGLGGKVVWIARPTRGEFHYYAHLDRQSVTAGTLVRRGDVIGAVGNTGNARGTPPHLHFGIYTNAGAVDPLPYIANPATAPRRAVAARKAPPAMGARASR